MSAALRLRTAALGGLCCLGLSGCTLIEHWMDGGATDPRAAPATTGDEAPPSAAAPAAAQGNGTPKEAVVAEEGGCALVFTEEDANRAFAVIGGLAADCVYDGVRVEAASMEVRWKPSEDSDDFFAATVAPKGCGEGTAVGELDVAIPASTRSSCPVAVEALEVALQANLLPSGSYR